MSKKRGNLKKDDNESRLRDLEIRFAFFKGAATVLIISVFVFLGATSWYTIPNAVKKQIDTAIGEKMKKKLDEAKKNADSILSASDLQDDVNSIDKSIIKLQQEIRKIKGS